MQKRSSVGVGGFSFVGVGVDCKVGFDQCIRVFVFVLLLSLCKKNRDLACVCVWVLYRDKKREIVCVCVCVCLECESQRGCGVLMAWRETDTKRKMGSREFIEKGLKSVETNQGSG